MKNQIQEKGSNVYSISTGNNEYCFLFQNELTVPRFIETEISGYKIPMYLDANDNLQTAFTHSMFAKGKLAGIMLCTNPPKNKRSLKSKVFEILNVINEAIAKAAEFGYIDVEFERPTEDELESMASEITSFYRKQIAGDTEETT